ncbi:MAG: flavodoxin family protein [Candidatus Hodarchaeota archaeon]
MNILGVCGSPRKKGNTGRLMRETLAAVQEQDALAETLFLCDYDIKQCDGCLFCEEKDCRGDCSIQDDMTNVIVPKILKADALVIGTPSYFDLPSGFLKLFMDRSNMILNTLCEKALPYRIIIVGQSDMTSLNAVGEAVKRYCAICGMRLVEDCTLQVIARDIGDVEKDKGALAKARNIGLKLLAEITEK